MKNQDFQGQNYEKKKIQKDAKKFTNEALKTIFLCVQVDVSVFSMNMMKK